MRQNHKKKPTERQEVTISAMTPSPKRTQHERREESRERILDAAEELFAKRGYHGVTMKDVSREAGVDAGLLHYYFAGKAGVFKAVIDRRADIVNTTRLASMQRYEKEAAGAMTVEGIVRAYLRPTFDFMIEGGDGNRHYAAMIAHLNSAPDGAIPDIETSPFDPVVQRFVEMLRKARPDCADADFYWLYHLISGAISLSLAQTGRIDRLSGGLCRSDDFEAIAERMTKVFGAALDAMSK
ncbi:MAG: TetR/AcrR family transcriptional regulator [Amphiplicatus sp.]